MLARRVPPLSALLLAGGTALAVLVTVAVAASGGTGR